MSLYTNMEETLDDRAAPNDDWNTVLFFPDQLGNNDTLKKFLSYFERAELRIQICVFRLTYRPLAEILVQKVKKEGLLVEILMDMGMYVDKDSRNNIIEWLLSQDIQIRLKRTGKNGDGHMHCKYAIIDEFAILTGSLNYTDQGLKDNDETVLVSTNPDYVKALQGKFKELWSHGKSASELSGSS